MVIRKIFNKYLFFKLIGTFVSDFQKNYRFLQNPIDFLSDLQYNIKNRRFRSRVCSAKNLARNPICTYKQSRLWTFHRRLYYVVCIVRLYQMDLTPTHHIREEQPYSVFRNHAEQEDHQAKSAPAMSVCGSPTAIRKCHYLKQKSLLLSQEGFTLPVMS